MKKLFCLLLVMLLLCGCAPKGSKDFQIVYPTVSPTEPESAEDILAYRRDVVEQAMREQSAILWTHVGHHKAVFHCPEASFLVGSRDHVATIVARAGVVGVSWTACDVVVLPEVVGTRDIVDQFRCQQFPRHPIGRMILTIEREAETLVTLHLAWQRIIDFNHVKVGIRRAIVVDLRHGIADSSINARSNGIATDHSRCEQGD